MAEIKCLNCGNRAIVQNPDGTEVVELLPIDKEPELKGKEYLISVCPHGCGCNTIALLAEKVPKRSTKPSGRVAEGVSKPKSTAQVEDIE